MRRPFRAAFAIAVCVLAISCGEEKTRGGLVPAPLRPATPGPGVEVDPDPARTLPPFLTEPIKDTRVVSFPTADEQARLVGRFFGDGGDRSRGVLLLHASDRDMRSWFPFARQLMDDGMAVLAFDFRGYGQSEGKKSPPEYPNDVAAGVDVLSAFGVSRIAIVGSEVGGTAAVGLPDRPASSVDGIVTLASHPRFEDLDVSEQARSIEAEALVLERTGSPSEFGDLIPEAERQAMDLGDLPERNEKVTTRIAGFVDEVLQN